MTNKSFEELLHGYIAGNLTKEELASFTTLLKLDENQQALQQCIDELLYSASTPVTAAKSRADVIFKKIMEAGNAENQKPPHNVFLLYKRSSLLKFVRVAAAVIVILLSAGIFFYVNNNKTNKPATVAATKNIPAGKKDILPGSNKATLLLADGTTLVLDDEKNGEVTQQGSIKVIKIDGKLAYNPSAAGSTEVVYNTISTPRGGQYQVALADGTLVWLNAASSLHFPTAFTGNERRVEITGEAYFEVAKNKDKPFVVVANGSEVQVFGTHFNVMAYNDEPELTTTLLEGSVKFISGASSGMLVPGQQSRLAKNGRLQLLDDVDVNAVVAWKNGLFHFENADIETVMKQLSRWYDVELVYPDNGSLSFQHTKMSDLLHADIPRNTKLADVLKVLEIAGGAKFEVDGKKIIIRK